MPTDRLSAMQAYLAGPHSNFSTRKHSRRSRGLSSPTAGSIADNPPCPQVAETPVQPDDFLLDVLQYFFGERLQRLQLNDDLGKIGAEAAWRAAQSLPAKPGADFPRPPANQPTRLWLGTPAVQTAFRRAQNSCALEGIKATIRTAMQSDYDLAKGLQEAVPMSRAKSGPDAPLPPNSFTTSEAGLRLITKFEGFFANLYNDPVGHCTIGYGTLVHRGDCNGSEPEEYRRGITQDRARELMRSELAGMERALNEAVTVELNQQQFDALASWTYNVGAGAMRRSTLVRLLNGGDFGAVPTELRKWVKASGRTLPGLVRRREEEATLFSTGAYPAAQSMQHGGPSSGGAIRQATYKYENPSRVMSTNEAYARAQNPGVIAGIAVADAIQIGLGAAAIVQSQVSSTQGSFTLSYDRAQRLLTTEARAQLPGAQTPKHVYRRRLFFIGSSGPVNDFANAEIILEWEGNAYGEIATPVMRRDLSTSSDWSRSSANLTISRIDRIPLPNTDPRAWPLIYTYEGTYDPMGNGLFEFSGEFEVNAFGGLKFNRHQVVSRSLLDFAIGGSPEDYVQKGADHTPGVPAVPQEQLDYLRTRL